MTGNDESERLSKKEKEIFTRFICGIGAFVITSVLVWLLFSGLNAAVPCPSQLTQTELDQIDRVFEEHYEQERKENEKEAELGRRIDDEIFKCFVLYKLLGK